MMYLPKQGFGWRAQSHGLINYGLGHWFSWIFSPIWRKREAPGDEVATWRVWKALQWWTIFLVFYLCFLFVCLFVCLFVFSPHLARHRFRWIWKKIFFVRILLLLSCFWKVWLKRWQLEYQTRGVCIMSGAAISHWERLPLRSHYSFFVKDWKGQKIFTCFLFIDVIIYFNVVFQTFPLIINCCCFRTVLWWI